MQILFVFKAVGTDRNIPDWVLQYRAETLSSLIELFHNNLDVMAEIYKNESFPIKLYHMLETYLKILMYSGNIFCNIPALKLPKVFMGKREKVLLVNSFFFLEC